MIPLLLPVTSEATERFVTKLTGYTTVDTNGACSKLVEENESIQLFSGQHGLFSLDTLGNDILGDIVVIDPRQRYAERLIRSNSKHNTLLVTERCDQLCVMCSQPPKKTHVDRFEEYKVACVLAPQDAVIGISGGEPTLFKLELFDLIETTLARRPDISFHVLTNGQHFALEDIDRLRADIWKRVTWGIPIYSHVPKEHDGIVAKDGALERLKESLTHLLLSGASIELRTVILQQNIHSLPDLARYVTAHLSFASQWSLMQLENIGFAKSRFEQLYFDHGIKFGAISEALDVAELFGVRTSLFNFTHCSVPPAYRRYCVPSISDWKQKFVDSCGICSKKTTCTGFFEWHPASHMKVNPI